jgi:hypothetical protein
MAKRLAIPSKELQLAVVGKGGMFKASRIQRLGLNTDIPSTTVDELGNPLHVGDVKDIPNVTLTFSAMDVGIKIFAALTGSSATAFPGAGVDISALDAIDALIFVKDPDATSYIKAAHAKRLYIRDFTFTYNVDGESTEDYTAVGSEKRWFSNDLQVDTYNAAGTPPVYGAPNSTVTLTVTPPVALKNGNKVLSVIADGDWLEEVAAGPAEGEYAVAGQTVTIYGDYSAKTVIVVYQVAANAASPDWADISDPLLPVAIRGKDAIVSIAANEMKRVQSVTINGTLNSQAVKEMGNRFIVGYQKQVPEVTGTITVLDTDTELMSLLQYGVTSSGTEYAPGEGCVTSGVSLKIELQDPCDTVAPYDVKKTVYLDSITVTGDSYTSNVNQNATQTFNFKSVTASCVVYSGAKP